MRYCRWLAPETLRQLQYSTKTDVWSYGRQRTIYNWLDYRISGIMCWEILNDGKEPYPGTVDWRLIDLNCIIQA